MEDLSLISFQGEYSSIYTPLCIPPETTSQPNQTALQVGSICSAYQSSTHLLSCMWMGPTVAPSFTPCEFLLPPCTTGTCALPQQTREFHFLPFWSHVTNRQNGCKWASSFHRWLLAFLIIRAHRAHYSTQMHATCHIHLKVAHKYGYNQDIVSNCDKTHWLHVFYQYQT